jgi:hypothetical protein
MGIGFQVDEKDNDYTGKTIEDYNHTIKIFGIPVFVATKKHVVDTYSNGRAPQ